MMHCVFAEIEKATDGRRRVRCADCGTELVTAAPLAAIRSVCRPTTGGRRVRVGDILESLIKQLGLKATSTCGCEQMIRQLNVWGVAGCRAHRGEIVEHLQTAYRGLTWTEAASAIAAVISSDLALRINPLDVCGSLVDEAIRRADNIFRRLHPS